ncbi:hypothetical protein [Bradyrhizobium sp. SSUT77]|nr:hypothetical protein [Bradyrhizobium sp. SSUT77]MDH2343669.1 hypothetical protein [Bradyrhizobium sp. SSUT77]
MERIEAQKCRLEHELANLPLGMQRDIVAARLEQLRTAAEMHEFLSLREEPEILR